MAIEEIFLGTTPNDGTGSPLRSGGQIINSNFKNEVFLKESHPDSVGTQKGIITRKLLYSYTYNSSYTFLSIAISSSGIVYVATNDYRLLSFKLENNSLILIQVLNLLTPGLNGARTIKIIGSYLYLFDSEPDSKVLKIDISNPAGMFYVDTFDPGIVTSMEPTEEYLFVGTSDPVDPDEIIVVNAKTFEEVSTFTDPDLFAPREMYVIDDYLFALSIGEAGQNARLFIIDKSDPFNLKTQGSLELTDFPFGTGEAFALKINNEKAYVVGQNTYVNIIDVSNKTNPSLLSSSRVKLISSRINNIAVFGDYLIGVINDTDEVFLYNVADSINPFLVEDTTTHPDVDNPRTLVVYGNMALVVSYSKTTITFFDIRGYYTPLLETGNLTTKGKTLLLDDVKMSRNLDVWGWGSFNGIFVKNNILAKNLAKNVVGVNSVEDLPVNGAGTQHVLKANTIYQGLGANVLYEVTLPIVFEPDAVLTRFLIQTNQYLIAESEMQIDRCVFVTTASGAGPTLFQIPTNGTVSSIENVGVQAPLDATIFDINGVAGPGVSIMKIKDFFINGCGNIGEINDVTFTGRDWSIFNNAGSLTFNRSKGLSIDVVEIASATHPLVHFKFGDDGDPPKTSGRIELSKISPTLPFPDQYAFYFDPVVAFKGISVGLSAPPEDNLGDLFDPSGLTEKSVGVKATGNFTVPDSTISLYATLKALPPDDETYIVISGIYYHSQGNFEEKEVERFRSNTFIYYENIVGGPFVADNTISAAPSGATGVILNVVDEGGGTGYLVINSVSGVFNSNDQITSAGTTADVQDPGAVSGKSATVYTEFEYIGVEDQILTVQCGATLSTTAPNEEVSIGIAKNEVIIPESITNIKIPTAGSATTLHAFSTKVNMVNGDHLDLYVANVSSATNILVRAASITISL
jgi:hypothetical protein